MLELIRKVQLAHWKASDALQRIEDVLEDDEMAHERVDYLMKQHDFVDRGLLDATVLLQELAEALQAMPIAKLAKAEFQFCRTPG